MNRSLITKLLRLGIFLIPVLIILSMSFFMGGNRAAATYLRFTTLFRIAIIVIVALALSAFVIHLLVDNKDNKKKPGETTTDLIILFVLFLILLFAIGWAYIILTISDSKAARVTYLDLISKAATQGI